MAGPLQDSIKEEIRVLLSSRQSIRQITKTLGLSRNTVRKIIRSEGLASLPVPSSLKENLNPRDAKFSANLQPLDFMMLEKMFAGSCEPGGAKDFEKHIKGLAVEIGQDLSVQGRIDILRIEVAVAHYVTWRRFYFRSLDAGDKDYCGSLAKRHDKVAKAANSWIAASNKAFDQMNRLLTSREFCYHLLC